MLVRYQLNLCMCKRTYGYVYMNSLCVCVYDQGIMGSISNSAEKNGSW